MLAKSIHGNKLRTYIGIIIYKDEMQKNRYVRNAFRSDISFFFVRVYGPYLTAGAYPQLTESNCFNDALNDNGLDLRLLAD